MKLHSTESTAFPTIDISRERASVVPELKDALSTWGGFICTGHGVPLELCEAVKKNGYEFFRLPAAEKELYHIEQGGASWRGYMPVGGERSVSGKIEDFKEGLYLGEEHEVNNPYCLAKLPTWGQNLLPDETLPEMRGVLQRYTTEVKKLGDRMMALIAVALDLPEKYIQDNITKHDAISLVRMFYYPPQAACEAPGAMNDQTGGDQGTDPTIDSNSLLPESDPDSPNTPLRFHDQTANSRNKRAKLSNEAPASPQAHGEQQRWGIGSHSDYGLWTMILTDAEGLEFLHPDLGWTSVPLVPGSFIMNAGDVLDRLTQGQFKSRHHRARNLSTINARLSIPFFYDPNWNARMQILPVKPDPTDTTREERWSNTKIRDHAFAMNVEYNQFLAKKVSKVFPDLVPKKYLASLDSTSAPSTRHHIVVHVPDKQCTASLVDNIQSDRHRVTNHELYASMKAKQFSLPVLRSFMEHHVWAVYDYFQLLKRLQQELTCVQVPWRPTANPAMRRFISEIVLEEECDQFEDGKTYGSHLELYIRAMEQVGADTRPILQFLDRLKSEVPHINAPTDQRLATTDQVCEMIESVGAPEAAVGHVKETLQLALEGTVSEVAAVFTFGREDVIPVMFSQLLTPITDTKDYQELPNGIFQYYLQRHIDLDGADHGPLAIALVEQLCGVDSKDADVVHRWEAAEAAVKKAFASRATLWDSVLRKIDSEH
mmetsp:Transcript_23858/g.28832  ORF Transcript_23858/g.28832 Transcript_23858/m.28832 type:complete len:713 (-) Transcript_23858:185-2323(-)|eukprot:CAMPEP_0197861308 /NCGR_PEP_ID=MMETSP1438-20131217/37277_1 /TAXON_ID=1461541 /ORGANISM="Pterosperma sp., Strain CCMP1384" /LENGTH=712 /DNA_ID=CAMNT_0043478443 /DNA_START=156 /DNA_END=2294 /DNA_ORIENTATION=+